MAAVRGAGVASLSLVWLAVAASPGVAQLPALADPGAAIYRDLAELESLGLLPLGVLSLPPLTPGEIRGLAADARKRLEAMARGGDATGLQADALVLLDRVDRRLRRSTRVDAGLVGELGGGRDPGRRAPANGLGAYRGVVNPFWSRPGGRTYGDRFTAALRGAVTMRPGEVVELGVSARAAYLRANGAIPRRAARGVEWWYAGVSVGRSVRVRAGRMHWWQGSDGRETLLLSGTGAPLRAAALSSSRSVDLGSLGAFRWRVTAASVGPRADFPDGGLFGLELVHLVRYGLSWSISILNRQGGEGAPAASLGDRLKDLSFVWDLFQPDRDFTFSDKRAGVRLRWRTGGGAPLLVDAEVVVDDLDQARLGDAVRYTSGARLSLTRTGLGAYGRHGWGLEILTTGDLLYRHHAFTDGYSVDGVGLGSPLGPGARSVRVAYTYHDRTAGTRSRIEFDWTRWTSDVLTRRPARGRVRVVRDGPAESLWSVRARVGRSVAPDLYLDFSGQVGWSRNHAFVAGSHRVRAGALLCIAWAW